MESRLTAAHIESVDHHGGADEGGVGVGAEAVDGEGGGVGHVHHRRVLHRVGVDRLERVHPAALVPPQALRNSALDVLLTLEQRCLRSGID